MKKTVLITGASSGIGKATAKTLHQQGYQVIAAARRVDRIEELKQLGIAVHPLDVTDEQSVSSCIDWIEDQYKGVDILINAAGYGHFGAVEDTPIETGIAQYEVNVFGLMRVTKAVIPSMRDKGHGKIINISSIGGKITSPFGGWYQSTKFAVEGMSDVLRMELKPFGIDVIVVEPGAILTEWQDIASNALSDLSGSGPYKEYVPYAIKAMENSYKTASQPEEIATGIAKAIQADKPKTRYAIGHRAGTFLFARWLLSDRTFDNMVMKEFMGVR
ncbi:oxidoreductase [Vibrio sp. SCSIO 43137]|uniref:oxidoreductase n=1 Tax=Vibrio sp. SCSIO 43137 TaxID=3021011 RepID=UPI002306FF27|nr:oxidoreductase [Vibrio sp. SCSIO 43137]WCE28376.1 oxidoreductase [Vibrio sp. SCSIO 43137]